MFYFIDLFYIQENIKQIMPINQPGYQTDKEADEKEDPREKKQQKQTSKNLVQWPGMKHFICIYTA